MKLLLEIWTDESIQSLIDALHKNMKKYVNILKYFNMHLTKEQINNTSKKLSMYTYRVSQSMRCSMQVNRHKIKVDAYLTQMVSSSLSVYTGSTATYCTGVCIASMLGHAMALMILS